jgi:hypothetical protein
MKTAYELAMEKLRKKDAERGVTRPPLDESQKAEIAEIRRVFEARIAEREILYKADLKTARSGKEPEAVATVEESYRRDRARLKDEREAKIRSVWRRGSKG